MPSGLQVFNENGGFIIDGTYMNLCLAKKETKSSQPQGNFNQISFSYLASDPTEIPPVLAISCDKRVIISGPVVSAGGQYDWLVISYAGPATATGYIFRGPPATGGNHGMQVFNDSGALVFDSTFPYMRIIDLIYDPPSNSEPAPRTKTYPGIVQIAFFQNTFAVEQSCFQFPDTPPRMQIAHTYYGASAIGNTLDMGRQNFSLQQFGFCGPGVVKRDSSITIVDVSGL